MTHTHTLLRGGPSLEFGAFWSQHAYKRRDPGELGSDLAFTQYLPPAWTVSATPTSCPRTSVSTVLQISTNTRFERDYTRTLQPLGSIARTWHSRQGPG